ncbi:MAG: NAD(P)-dependent oxidoreductase [Pseudomonadota bacterium]
MESMNLGWIGTGMMGRSMCSHLLAAGHRLSIHNRTPEKAKALTDAGALWCKSPAEVAENSDIVFTIVGFPADVEEVILGNSGVLAGARPQSTIVDMTTSSPALARTIYEKAKTHEIDALDAPVSGGDVGAREATLTIMVGGDETAYQRCLPLFQIMGKNIARMGNAGAGQHTKMSNQISIAGTMIGVVESLLYTWKAGLDLNAVIDVIGQGAAGSWSINNLGRRIAKGDFNPGFLIKHFVKDMEIALDEARRVNLSLPGLSLAHQFYRAAMAQGLENLGTQGLYKVFSAMNGSP